MFVPHELDVNKHTYVDPPHVFVRRAKCNRFVDHPIFYRRKDKEVPSNDAIPLSLPHTTSNKAPQLSLPQICNPLLFLPIIMKACHILASNTWILIELPAERK